MTTEEAKAKLETDSDFIALKRFDYSLENLVERYPEGCNDRIIAQALLITEDDVEDMYLHIVEKLRNVLEVE